MLLAYSIFILGILSFLIWIYQAIVLPGIRQWLRFRLFRLRDETRELVITGHLKEDSAVFRGLHNRLNMVIKAVPAIDIALLYAVQGQHPDIEDRALRFEKLIDDSIPEVRAIFHNVLKVVAFALIANSFLWVVGVFIAAIPAAISQGVWKLLEIVRQRIKVRVQAAFELKEIDLEYMPSLSTSAETMATIR